MHEVYRDGEGRDNRCERRKGAWDVVDYMAPDGCWLMIVDFFSGLALDDISSN